MASEEQCDEVFFDGKRKRKNSSDLSAADALTKEEADVYDRQIRLWGVEAQQKLRKAKILVVGTSGLGNEVIKNVLLAGVKHMTILDSKSLSAEDVSGQFLAAASAVGENRAEACIPRARELNPMVDIVSDTGNVREKAEDFFAAFDVVCVTGESDKTQVHVNDICHRLGVKFLSGNVFGYYGYMFADLGTHSFVEEKIKQVKHSRSSLAPKKPRLDETTEVEMVEHKTRFCSLANALAHNHATGKSLRQLKQISKAYLVMRVLHAYTEKRDVPKKMMSRHNVQELLEARNDELELIGMDADMLDDEFACLCVGELYPVNAIIGGVLSQEIIKAISHKDRPHDNFFFYDGDATTGVVLRVAPPVLEKKKLPTNQKASVAGCIDDVL